MLTSMQGRMKNEKLRMKNFPDVDYETYMPYSQRLRNFSLFILNFSFSNYRCLLQDAKNYQSIE